MGKKAFAKKIKPHRQETPEAQPQPNPPPPAPTAQPPPMISLDAMMAFLRQQDPTRDWMTALTSFGQMGGVGTAPSEIPPAPVSHKAVHSEEGTSSATAPSETSVPNSAELDAIAAHYDSGLEEHEEKTTQEGSGGMEKTPEAEPVSQEVAREDLDLNESAQKRTLMTDEEFDSILNQVNQAAQATTSEAEGLDPASKAVGVSEETGGVSEPEGPAYQPEEEKGNTITEAKETETETEAAEPEVEAHTPMAPQVVKPIPVRRRLVVKTDSTVDRPKPQRVSQRCLGKWASSRAEPNTAADPLEIVSDDERTTPTKPGEESSPFTDPEDAEMVVEEPSLVQVDQGVETERMAEGPDLASKVVSPERPEKDDAKVESSPTTQEEVRYKEERKRKGKAIMRKQPSTKKPRVVNTKIVITEATQRTPPSRRELSDDEYTASTESSSDSNISLADEEYTEQQLLDDHRELVHPPVERLRYRKWTVDLTDDVVEEMTLFDSKELKSAYRTKDDKSKQIKSGKVLHLPSLDKLKARESFLALLHALGFEWLLENEVMNIPVKLAKEFFSTF
ncbi:serine-aspartate repeat-containing protein I-like [Salvia splendens]|uniref:serine-aspartate repeat-containing protein I-like n=1 Tax=Salvia splendens TaxID=180675 RepID=UPI001C25E408|nr:serine-aspartate repeat-containing protein I-like [Salvia splendens]